MRRLPLLLLAFVMLFCACEGEQEHLADAINDEDSIAMMRSRGISTLISDSGVLRYKLIAEEWDIYTNTVEPTWKFYKGMLMERFDESFHVDLYVQADTAYLHEQRTWELRGRVNIRNVQGTVFRTEELFWDMQEHEMWSHKFIRIVTPERELQGTEFHSNEQMTNYSVTNSAGAFPVSDTEKEEEKVDTAKAVANTQAQAKQESNTKVNTPANNTPKRQAPMRTPTGQKVGRVMPSAPGKSAQRNQQSSSAQGHWK